MSISNATTTDGLLKRYEAFKEDPRGPGWDLEVEKAVVKRLREIETLGVGGKFGGGDAKMKKTMEEERRKREEEQKIWETLVGKRKGNKVSSQSDRNGAKATNSLGEGSGLDERYPICFVASWEGGPLPEFALTLLDSIEANKGYAHLSLFIGDSPSLLSQTNTKTKLSTSKTKVEIADEALREKSYSAAAKKRKIPYPLTPKSVPLSIPDMSQYSHVNLHELRKIHPSYSYRGFPGFYADAFCRHFYPEYASLDHHVNYSKDFTALVGGGDAKTGNLLVPPAWLEVKVNATSNLVKPAAGSSSSATSGSSNSSSSVPDGKEETLHPCDQLEHHMRTYSRHQAKYLPYTASLTSLLTPHIPTFHPDIINTSNCESWSWIGDLGTAFGELRRYLDYELMREESDLLTVGEGDVWRAYLRNGMTVHNWRKWIYNKNVESGGDAGKKVKREEVKEVKEVKKDEPVAAQPPQAPSPSPSPSPAAAEAAPIVAEGAEAASVSGPPKYWERCEYLSTHSNLISYFRNLTELSTLLNTNPPPASVTRTELGAKQLQLQKLLNIVEGCYSLGALTYPNTTTLVLPWTNPHSNLDPSKGGISMAMTYNGRVLYCQNEPNLEICRGKLRWELQERAKIDIEFWNTVSKFLTKNQFRLFPDAGDADEGLGGAGGSEDKVGPGRWSRLSKLHIRYYSSWKRLEEVFGDAWDTKRYYFFSRGVNVTESQEDVERCLGTKMENGGGDGFKGTREDSVCVGKWPDDFAYMNKAARIYIQKITSGGGGGKGAGGDVNARESVKDLKVEMMEYMKASDMWDSGEGRVLEVMMLRYSAWARAEFPWESTTAGTNAKGKSNSKSAEKEKESSAGGGLVTVKDLLLSGPQVSKTRFYSILKGSVQIQKKGKMLLHTLSGMW
jgi:hypothetical protein